MCGRIDLHNSVDEIAERFAADVLAGFEVSPNYNVAPTSTIPIVSSREGKRMLEPARWGIVPFGDGRPPLFNARADKLMQLGRYKAGVERRRCIVPVSGFYEWKRAGKERLPHYIHASDGDILGLAGFWERSGDGPEGIAATIITSEANSAMESLHDRMPVILAKEDEALWLDPGVSTIQDLLPCIQPSRDDLLSIYAVSSMVNNSRNNLAECNWPLS